MNRFQIFFLAYLILSYPLHYAMMASNAGQYSLEGYKDPVARGMSLVISPLSCPFTVLVHLATLTYHAEADGNH